MAGQLRINPMIKTYEESRRTLVRLNQFINQWGSELSKQQYENIKMIIEKTEEIIDIIPKEYHLTHSEIRELYKK